MLEILVLEWRDFSCSHINLFLEIYYNSEEEPPKIKIGGAKRKHALNKIHSAPFMKSRTKPTALLSKTKSEPLVNKKHYGCFTTNDHHKRKKPSKTKPQRKQKERLKHGAHKKLIRDKYEFEPHFSLPNERGIEKCQQVIEARDWSSIAIKSFNAKSSLSGFGKAFGKHDDKHHEGNHNSTIYTIKKG